MPAPKQAQTPVYKETANVKRFNTNWAQHDPRKQAGSALAKALGAGKNVIHDQATMQKKIDLEEGKRLALMGVARENLAEAAGSGGMFSGAGGWTMQGYDMQRGIEDAFIRQSQLVEAFNSSGLSGTDDIAAFQAFADAQREAIFAELEGKPDFYREGFMEGISPAFQKMGRAWAGTAESFRTQKKTAAFKERVRASVLSGETQDIKALVGDAPNSSGVSTKDAAAAGQEVILEEADKGNIDPNDPEVEAQLNNENKERLAEIAERKAKEDEALERITEANQQERQRNLVYLAVQGKDEEALKELRNDFPEVYQQTIDRMAQIGSKDNPEIMDQLKTVLLSDKNFGTPQVAQEIENLYLSGELDEASYQELTSTNENQLKHGHYLDNYKIKSILTRSGINDLGDEDEALARSILLEEVSDYYESSGGKYPKSTDFYKWADSLANTLKPADVAPPPVKPAEVPSRSDKRREVSEQQQQLMDKYN